MSPSALHLSSAHPPFDTRVFHKECRSLVDAGYEVTLAVPDAPEGTHRGVRLVSVPKAQRRWQRLTTTQGALWRIARRSDADVVHFHDPDLILMGALLAARGRTVLYDSHEDVSRQLADRTWIPVVLRGLTSRIVRVVERLCVTRFAGVISAEPAGAHRFPPHKTVVVQNFPRPEEFEGLDTIPYGDRDRIVFYVGDITRARGALQMVDAIASLPGELDARLVLAGRISEPGLERELQQSPGWDRTEYLGVIDRTELRRQLARARLGIVVMQPTVQYREATQPVKLFEYMAAGLPVVASDFVAWRPFVGDVEAGLLVDPTDPSAIAAGIDQVLRSSDAAQEMGRRGQQAVLDGWIWESEARKLLALYEEVVR